MKIRPIRVLGYPMIFGAALIACSVMSSGAVSAKSVENEVRILSVSQGYQEIGVTIDGNTQTFEQPALLINGATMVPMRGVFQALGATIEWDQASQTVTGNKGDTIIKLTVGQNVAYVNGNKVSLATNAQIINGSTLVPLRFVSEALGATVSWDDVDYTAIISSKDSSSTGGTAGGGEIKDVWNRGAVDPVSSGNVEIAVNKLSASNPLNDVAYLPEDGYNMFAHYYGGPYYIKARLKGYTSVPIGSSLYNLGVRYKFYLNYAFEDYVIYSTSDTLPANKEELKVDAYMIFSGFFTGKEIIDYTEQVKAELQELLMGVKEAKSREILKEYLADGKIDSLEASYLSYSDRLLADSIAYQLSTIPEQKDEYFAFVSNSGNIHLLTQENLDKINFKENFENDLFKVREYINIPYRIYDKYSISGMYSYNSNQNDVNTFFNNYEKALSKIEWFKEKYPDKWASAEYTLFGVNEKFVDTLNYFEEARSRFVSFAESNGYYVDSKNKESLLETQSANSEVVVDKYAKLSEVPSIFEEIDKEYQTAREDFESNSYNEDIISGRIIDIIRKYNVALEDVALYKELTRNVSDYLVKLYYNIRGLTNMAYIQFVLENGKSGENVLKLEDERDSIKHPLPGMQSPI